MPIRMPFLIKSLLVFSNVSEVGRTKVSNLVSEQVPEKITEPVPTSVSKIVSELVPKLVSGQSLS